MIRWPLVRAIARVLRRLSRRERHHIRGEPVADGLPACPWTDLGGEA